MFSHLFNGRILGLLCVAALPFYCSGLHAAQGSASSKHAEVAVKYKSKGLAEFHLADYEAELLECSALAAMHTWIGDNIGQDAGSEVRKAIDEDYWLKISKDYLSLARDASGRPDMSQEFRVRIRGLTAEWRRLNETPVDAGEWEHWYDLVYRCDTWRSKNTRRSFYSQRSESMAAQNKAPNAPGG